MSTTEPNNVAFTITGKGFNFSGTLTTESQTLVTIPTSFEVQNNNVSNQNKGLHVKTERGKKISVHGFSYTPFTTDGFLALPCSNLGLDVYEYYSVTYATSRKQNSSDILIVGCEDDTVINTPFSTVRLSRLDTYLIRSPDSSGIRVTSSKPVSFFTSEDCSTIPSHIGYCDHLFEQIPPTSIWGKFFLVASLLRRDIAGTKFRFITTENSTVVKVNCTSFSAVKTYTLNYTRSWKEFSIYSTSFCSIESSAPILLMQFTLGSNIDNIGDPFMMMIPPVEQYSNRYIHRRHTAILFRQEAATIYVLPEYYQPKRIIHNRKSVTSLWTPVYCSNGWLCGYITRVSLDRSYKHRIFHQDPDARIGISFYGFSVGTSYGYPGGLKVPAVHCKLCYLIQLVLLNNIIIY